MMIFSSDDYLETVGKVTAVTDVSTDPSEKSYDVNFTYIVDGKTYNSTFSGIGGDHAVGEEIKVFYDPANPQNITNSKADKFLAPIFVIAGAGALVFGIYQTIKAFKKSKELDAATPGKGAPDEASNTRRM